MKALLKYPVGIVFLYLWFISTDIYQVPADLIPDLSILLLVFVATVLLRIKTKRTDRKVPILVPIVAFWIVASIVDVLRLHELPLTGENSTVLHASPLSTRRVSLALSGGGYRAALFHAGVIDGLQSLGIEARNLSVVSGGGIIGSFYRIGGDPDVFKAAVISGKFNLKREVLLFHNLIRLPFPFSIPTTDISLVPSYKFSRLDVQRNLLKRTINPDRQTVAIPRKLVVGISDLNYGMQIAAFDNTALLFDPLRGKSDQVSFGGFAWEKQPSISRLISYSGAFPGAFPATDETVRINSGAQQGQGSKRNFALVDGGVIDNLGIKALAWLDKYATASGGGHLPDIEWRSDVIVSSDAGVHFPIVDGVSGIESLIRAFKVADKYKSANVALPHEWGNNGKPIISIGTLKVETSGKSKLISDSDNQYDLGIQPYSMNKSILSELVLLIPTPNQAETGASLKRLNQYDTQALLDLATPNEIRLITQNFTAQYTKPNCLELVKNEKLNPSLPLWQVICESEKLRHSLRQGIGDMLKTFTETPTLKDVYDSTTAELVFKLGKVLILLGHKDF